jgi:uncharacterized protein GlcG (DUF336 family)
MRTRRRNTLASLAVCAAVALLLRGETPTAIAAPEGHDVMISDAMRVIDAAIKKALATETKMNIAVVDAGGNLKAFARMDGAYLGSIDIAIKKARTSRFFDAPTGALGTMTQPGGPLFGLEETNDGLVTFAGGLPLRNSGGDVIGAIGVSGSSVENDLAVAEAGAAAF